jgi:hypothetical protein
MTFGTVLWTFIGALFGAAFGYILGWIIELLTGMGGMPALLAALGFMAGAALGILVSLALLLITRGVYREKFHEAAHRFGHSLRHGRVHAMRNYYWSDGCACEHVPEPYSVEDTLQELDGYLSYLEDLPEERLASYGDKLARLNDRLNKLRASLHY